MDEYINIFLDTEATKETVIQGGTANFKYIYHGRDTTLGDSVQHVLKEGSGRSDQTRDPTSNRGCICTAFTPCLASDPGLDLSTEHVSEPQ